jgi:hypothetical protein
MSDYYAGPVREYVPRRCPICAEVSVPEPVTLPKPIQQGDVWGVDYRIMAECVHCWITTPIEQWAQVSKDQCRMIVAYSPEIRSAALQPDDAD